MRWLHLSDVHFSGNNSYDQNRLVKALLKSLPNLILRFGNPDFVFFTGDVAQSGKKTEYAEAGKFFDQLLDILELERRRLLVIPGNHDVDRGHSGGLSRSFGNRKEIDDLFGGNTVYQIAARQSAFKEWYESYFVGRAFPTDTTTYLIENFDLEGFPLEVWGLNSAAFSFDHSDQGNLILSQRCITDALGDAGGKDVLRIGLIHHPITWLSDVERSGVRAAVNDAFDILLHGHLHENEVEIARGSSGQSVTISCGALYQGSDWPNVANFGRLSGNDLEIHPIKYHDLPREIWTADPSLFPDDPDYAGRFIISRKGSELSGAALDETGIGQVLTSNKLSDGWQSNLFAAPSGKPIYTEPRLSPKPQSLDLDFDEQRDTIPIHEIISSSKSYIIESRAEYGGTTLIGRLSTEIRMRGHQCFIGDARKMPNYKKKIVDEISSSCRLSEGKIVVLLDNVDLERDRKLLSEVQQVSEVSRTIALASNRGLVPSGRGSNKEAGFEFEELYLWTLARSQIRSLAESFFDTNDQEIISSVTQKVYDDLLGLCIPLTPNNVVMYMKILFVDGSFIPLNRVDILQKFLLDSLRKPSDSYTGSFNYKNKIDLIANFAKFLYITKSSSFKVKTWINFCDTFKSETLLGFNTVGVLDEILDARIFVRHGEDLYFRYSFFYSFALGLSLVDDHCALKDFLADKNYTGVADVLDVVTALRPNDP